MRCLPLIFKNYEENEEVPQLFALGFAAYLYFMKAVKKKGKDYYGEFDGEDYLIEDDMAAKLYELWQNGESAAIVKNVLKNISFWGKDLTLLPGFQQSVTDKLNSIIKNGMRVTLEAVRSKKNFVK